MTVIEAIRRRLRRVAIGVVHRYSPNRLHPVGDACNQILVPVGGREKLANRYDGRGVSDAWREKLVAIHPFSAAKMICRRSGWSATNLSVQKILYLAHMVHLGRTGEPLVRETFQAWDYGPVLPSLYHKVSAFGSKPIPNVFTSALDVDDTPEGQTLREACDNLLANSPGQLVENTHWSGGAWAKHYQAGVRGIVIPDADIAAEYRARMERPVAAGQRRD